MRVLVTNYGTIYLSERGYKELVFAGIEEIKVQRWCYLKLSRKFPQVVEWTNDSGVYKYFANFPSVTRCDKRILDVFDVMGQDILHDQRVQDGQILKTIDIPDGIQYSVIFRGNGEVIVERARSWKF